jgi:DNA-binding IclR family transcriptional regulator
MERRAPASASPSTPKKPIPRYRAPALEKGLEILELLSDRPEGLTQAEVARSLSRSVGEIFRMLACLVDRGYLTLAKPGDRYVLTTRLFELSHRHAPQQRLLAEALPVMRELAAEIRQSCHLVVAYEGKGVVVAQADHPYEMGFGVRPGCTVDLRTSASGRILLAFQDATDRARLVREGGGKPHAAETLRFFDELDRVRERGFEEIESARVRGVRDFSFPVVDHRGAALAALTVPFIERLDRAESDVHGRLRKALGEAAKRLSQSVGGRAAAAADSAGPAAR